VLIKPSNIKKQDERVKANKLLKHFKKSTKGSKNLEIAFKVFKN